MQEVLEAVAIEMEAIREDLYMEEDDALNEFHELARKMAEIAIASFQGELLERALAIVWATSEFGMWLADNR